ncbi:hypothetical protein TALC_00357 [Thermoplasmatales archaeon BRNA1]|nr:hypothetical protein TALC_00357 [Thermoplasmatales archaeon BRNA1]
MSEIGRPTASLCMNCGGYDTQLRIARNYYGNNLWVCPRCEKNLNDRKLDYYAGAVQ